MFSRWKRSKSIKIDAPNFRPLGGRWPRRGRTAEEVLENITYLEAEMVRWNESLAWVDDLVGPRNITAYLCDACSEAKIIVTDDNAPAVTKILATIPSSLSPWQCTIIRDTETYYAIVLDLSNKVLHVAEDLQTLCQASDALPHLRLRSLANSAKSFIWLTLKDKAALPFTLDQVEAEANTFIASRP